MAFLAQLLVLFGLNVKMLYLLELNTYINPLVNDLFELWRGKQLSIPNFDVPFWVSHVTSQQLGKRGFLSHSAKLGCSKCYYEFFDGTKKADYGGSFNRESWQTRTNARHRADVQKLQSCSSVSARYKDEIKYDSVLLDLPYYDPIAC